MPDSSSVIFPGATRSNSLASTVSSSGASLTRRSRIRKRTRTTTESSRPECVPNEFDTVLDISASHTQELVSTTVDGPSEAPIDPPASHSETGNTTSNPNTSNGTCGTFGQTGRKGTSTPGSGGVGPASNQPEPPRRVEIIAAPTTFLKGKGRNSNLPRLTSPPSAFRPTPVEGDTVRSSMRDSLLTQQSSTSSSVYPLSTSTGTESPPSPVSPVEQTHAMTIPAVGLDVPRVQEFDADDVSYRLRLLMKNSYFLPPAHSKPSPSDFPPAINPTKKAPAPAFLDLFRVGKAKSKPGSPDAAAPVVRVTSDSTTASGHAGTTRDHPRPSMQVFRPPVAGQHMTRVVVVREKVDDLDTATKQAEVDLNGHEFLADRERATRRSKPEIFDGIVDPTDVVDIPPPSANYPLALQASALHGMGIEESVGAAVLAERLPPPGSPGASILDPRDNAWRKALLHEAVNHSLNNSAASLSIAQSTPTKSPHHVRSSESLNRRAILQQQKLLDQKILSHPIIDPSDDFDPPLSPTPAAPVNPSGPAATLIPAPMPDIHRLSNYAPLRVETPVPHMPLSPPPRRALPYSKSQTDLSIPLQAPLARESRKVLRRSMSSPMLSDGYEVRTSGTRTPTTKTPPPMPSLSISPAPSSHHRISLITSLSRYASEPDDIVVPNEPNPRPSLTLSVQSIDGRPTASEYSQPSPTASAFRDRWSEGYYSANSQVQLAEAPHNPRESLTSPGGRLTRISAMSPPPRSSSSVAGVALTPAPRPGYLPFHSTPSRTAQPSRSSSELSRGTFRSFVSASASQHMQLPTPLDVNLSVLSFHSAFHSAPPPSSTAEFFDHIQGYPSAMDGLYDSEDSASEVDPELTAVYAPPSQSQRSFTRLGNHSTPDIICGATVPYYPTGIPKDRRKPVGNVPPKNHYFTNLKASPHSLTQLSLSQHSTEHLVDSHSSSPVRRPATPGEENIRRWQREQLNLEQSSKKLDGMVMQHMQAERDTMRRIAETAKVPKS